MMHDSVSRLEELLDKVRANREVLRRQRQQQSSQGLISYLNRKIAGDKSEEQLSPAISTVISSYEQSLVQDKVLHDIADVVDPFAKEADSFVPTSQEPVLPMSASPVESFAPEVEEAHIQGYSFIPTVESSALESLTPEVEEEHVQVDSFIPTVESSALESFEPEVENYQRKDQSAAMSPQEVDIPDSEDNYSPEGFVSASDVQEAKILETAMEMEPLETEVSSTETLEKKFFNKDAEVSGPIIKVIEQEVEKNWTIKSVLSRAWLVGNME